MDTLAGLAFAGEPPLAEYMRETPKRRDEPVLNRYMLHQIVCMGLFTVAILIGWYGEHCPLGIIIMVFFVFLQDVPCRVQ